MAGMEQISTEQVEAIATDIYNSNQKLKATLMESQEVVNSLKSTWEGEASDATITAYKSFSSKYFDSYYDIIDSYVKFLRNNVAQGYVNTEKTATGLAGSFK